MKQCTHLSIWGPVPSFAQEMRKNGCGKPAFYSLELGSFSYCSPECRDRCELEGARRDVASFMKGVEVNPAGRGSSQAPANESVNHRAMSQPPTRYWPQSDDMPTTPGIPPGALPTQQPPPQQASLSVCNSCPKMLFMPCRCMTMEATDSERHKRHKLLIGTCTYNATCLTRSLYQQPPVYSDPPSLTECSTTRYSALKLYPPH